MKLIFSAKRIIYVVIVALVLIATTFLCIGLNTSEFKRSITQTSTPELMERGREYYRRQHMDSALMIFSYVADNYNLSMTKDEKRLSLLAKNNVGIIYSFEYLDYPRGYEVLKSGYELAEEPGFEDTQAIMCHNLVSLLRLYSTCLNSDNADERIEKYTRLGVEKALAGKEYGCLASMVINALHQNMEGELGVLEEIENPAIPDSIEGVDYARELLQVARLYQLHHTDSALMLLEKSYIHRPSYNSPNQYIIGHYRAIAAIYANRKDYEQAEKYALKSLAHADSVKSLDSKLESLAFLSRLPISRKSEYERRFLQVKDSALTQGRIQMVSEIDFVCALNQEREENRKMAEQRTRLFWGLGIGLVLILIFGIMIFFLIKSGRHLREKNAALYARIRKDLDKDEKLSREPSGVADAVQPNVSEATKYAGSSLSQEKMEEIFKRMEELLADEKWVCDSEVSLARTASLLNVNTTYLSRVINEKYGKSLSVLISEYRIRIATRRMGKDSVYANQTIESIANSVGYSSRSSFIAAFKRVNGMTPSEYMKASKMT